MAFPNSHGNFAYTTLNGAVLAGDSSLVVTSATGFPTAATADSSTYFNCTIWPTNSQPTSSTAEIVTVTNTSGTTFSITRAQEGTSALGFSSGDQIAATITAKTLTDAEGTNAVSYSPYLLASAGTSVITMVNNISVNGSGSLFIFPITVPMGLQFNQLMIPVSMSYSTAVTGGANTSYAMTHSSKYGLYSMTGNTLTLISSSQFTIGETWSNSQAFSVCFPTSTYNNGYSYSNFVFASNTPALTDSVVGLRAVGLQFGANMTLAPNVYWLGLLDVKSTGSTAASLGLSNAGVWGQIFGAMNSMSTAALNPLGVNSAGATLSQNSISGFFGRNFANYLSNTYYDGFYGTGIPGSIDIKQLTGTATVVSVLPTVTFVST